MTEKMPCLAVNICPAASQSPLVFLREDNHMVKTKEEAELNKHINSMTDILRKARLHQASLQHHRAFKTHRDPTVIQSLHLPVHYFFFSRKFYCTPPLFVVILYCLIRKAIKSVLILRSNRQSLKGKRTKKKSILAGNSTGE